MYYPTTKWMPLCYQEHVVSWGFIKLSERMTFLLLFRQPYLSRINTKKINIHAFFADKYTLSAHWTNYGHISIDSLFCLVWLVWSSWVSPHRKWKNQVPLLEISPLNYSKLAGKGQTPVTVAGTLKVALKSSLPSVISSAGNTCWYPKTRENLFPFHSENVAIAVAFASLSEIKLWFEYSEEDQQTSAKNVYSSSLRIWFDVITLLISKTYTKCGKLSKKPKPFTKLKQL